MRRESWPYRERGRKVHWGGGLCMPLVVYILWYPFTGVLSGWADGCSAMVKANNRNRSLARRNDFQSGGGFGTAVWLGNSVPVRSKNRVREDAFPYFPNPNRAWAGWRYGSGGRGFDPHRAISQQPGPGHRLVSQVVV